MKLISRTQPDYWDYLLKQWGEDKGHHLPTWIRKTEAIHPVQEPEINSLYGVPGARPTHYILNGYRYYLEYSFVVIAGKAYPVIISIPTSPDDETGTVNYIYGLYELAQLPISDQGGQPPLDLMVGYLNQDFKQSYPYVTAALIVKLSGDIERLGHGKNATAVKATSEQWEKNILLSDIQAYKRFSADKVFRLIESYVNYQFNTENQMTPLSGESLIAKHGFDKQSFRKRKDP